MQYKIGVFGSAVKEKDEVIAIANFEIQKSKRSCEVNNQLKLNQDLVRPFQFELQAF
ncbi:MAG: hypothetical protein US54_C0028G0009 [Candidatus Roizmanbacteria bacterium GW2011_GWA2_37_7]|uniref:Uncharacterized protein n=1 Tax=Candidatus Roizmanbacteria bacterium GW2011_GWA2_37_7 TaxID=1618481 RepID=A0A0G0H376_9BACT|nr:MAG: hypothetical protein US54_C0028G0009 [Candidatus Roizmanbacteria bacterium GW2011_GWA2_37_7]